MLYHQIPQKAESERLQLCLKSPGNSSQGIPAAREARRQLDLGSENVASKKHHDLGALRV